MANPNKPPKPPHGNKPPEYPPPPPAPTNLTVKLMAPNNVLLQWDPIANAQGYWIYRNNYVPWIAYTNSYAEVVPNGTYIYEVAAVVAEVLGPKSNSVTITV